MITEDKQRLTGFLQQFEECLFRDDSDRESDVEFVKTLLHIQNIIMVSSDNLITMCEPTDEDSSKYLDELEDVR